MVRHFLNPPNWFTAASIFCSSLAIASLVGHEVTPELLSRSAVLVILGAIFDMLDGRVARWTGRYSEFGIHLDTIADFLGFGVAPALMAWAWKLHELGRIGFVLAFAYTVCAAFRLARFNIAAIEGSWNLPGHSQGLTTTMAGGTVVTWIWVSSDYLREVLHPDPRWVGAFVGFLGLLMVSNFPFRNFRDLRANRNAARLLAVSLAASLVGAVLLDVSMLWGIGAVLYLAIGLGDAIVFAIQRRRLSHALLIDEIEEALAEDAADPGVEVS